MELITIRSMTEYLSSANILPGLKEQFDFYTLREHVGKIAAVVAPLCCTELQGPYKELHERKQLVSNKVRDATEVASKAAILTSIKPDSIPILRLQQWNWLLLTGTW